MEKLPELRYRAKRLRRDLQQLVGVQHWKSRRRKKKKKKKKKKLSHDRAMAGEHGQDRKWRGLCGDDLPQGSDLHAKTKYVDVLHPLEGQTQEFRDEVRRYLGDLTPGQRWGGADPGVRTFLSIWCAHTGRFFRVGHGFSASMRPLQRRIAKLESQVCKAAQSGQDTRALRLEAAKMRELLHHKTLVLHTIAIRLILANFTQFVLPPDSSG